MTAAHEPGPTVVADPPSARALVWVGFPILGAALGWAVVALADWVTTLSWAPLQGPFELVADLPRTPATLGAIAIGVVGGLGVAVLAAVDSLRVEVADDAIRTRRGEQRAVLPRAEVAAAFHDGKQLVVVDPAGAELLRERSDLPKDRVAQAFREHGYVWHDDGDPFGDRFRRWVDGEPGLPDGANAVLKARQKALDGGQKDDLAEFRGELARLGVVVREEGKRQYWRPARG